MTIVDDFKHQRAFGAKCVCLFVFLQAMPEGA